MKTQMEIFDAEVAKVEQDPEVVAARIALEQADASVSRDDPATEEMARHCSDILRQKRIAALRALRQSLSGQE